MAMIKVTHNLIKNYVADISHFICKLVQKEL